MNRIEPGELQERFDRGLKRGALLGAANKMKYWDLYTEFYQVLNQRNEQNLPTLFAEELARTYAEKADAEETLTSLPSASGRQHTVRHASAAVVDGGWSRCVGTLASRCAGGPVSVATQSRMSM